MSLLLALLKGVVALFTSASSSSGRPAANQRAPARQAETSEALCSYAPDFKWPDSDDYDFEIVGESFCQPALQRVAHALEANAADSFDVALVPYANKHDKLAVGVMSADRELLGHLSREDARSYRRRLGATKRTGKVGVCKARLIGGHRLKDGGVANIGVVLNLAPFE